MRSRKERSSKGSSSTHGLASIWAPGMVITFADIFFLQSVLSQRLHVTHDRIQVRIAQLHSGHQRARFDRTGVLNPKTKTVASVLTAPAAIVARLIKCVRIGPKRPFAAVPAIVWQFMQALPSNTRLPAA